MVGDTGSRRGSGSQLCHRELGVLGTTPVTHKKLKEKEKVGHCPTQSESRVKEQCANQWVGVRQQCASTR